MTTTFRRGVGRRFTAITVACLVASVALSGCQGESEPEPQPTVTTAEPAPEDDAEAAYERYWDIYIQMANSGVVDAAAFSGVAEGSFIELDLKNLRDQAEAGIVRVGEPPLSDFTTTVDGDTATSLVCVDQAAWRATSASGETLPAPEDLPPTPFEATLELRDNAWIVTDRRSAKDQPCP